MAALRSGGEVNGGAEHLLDLVPPLGVLLHPVDLRQEEHAEAVAVHRPRFLARRRDEPVRLLLAEAEVHGAAHVLRVRAAYGRGARADHREPGETGQRNRVGAVSAAGPPGAVLVLNFDQLVP